MLGASNGFSPDQLNAYLAPIDKADEELASLRGEYMADCKGPRASIKNAKKLAKHAGINMAAFNELVETRRAARAKEQRLAKLEYSDLDDYNAMIAALGEFGDTPLGAAALERAKPRGEEALDSLDEGPPPERADEARLSELGRG
jgi:hypothetical protein